MNTEEYRQKIIEMVEKIQDAKYLEAVYYFIKRLLG